TAADTRNTPLSGHSLPAGTSTTMSFPLCGGTTARAEARSAYATMVPGPTTETGSDASSVRTAACHSSSFVATVTRPPRSRTILRSRLASLERHSEELGAHATIRVYPALRDAR